MKKTLLIWALAIATIAVLCALFVLFPMLAGTWRWHRVKSELLARGEKLRPEEFSTPKVAPSENYFEMPYFAEVDGRGRKGGTQADRLKEALGSRDFRSWRAPKPKSTYVLETLPDVSTRFPVKGNPATGGGDADRVEKLVSSFQSIRDEAVQYKDRPVGYSRAGIEDFQFDPVVTASVTLARLLESHCKLAMVDGRMDEAKQDVLALVGMARAITTNERTSEFSGRTYLGMTCGLIRLGMEQWSPEDLREFQQILGKSLPTLGQVAQALRYDRASLNYALEGKWLLDTSVEGEPPFPWRKQWFSTLAKSNFNSLSQQWIDACQADVRLPRAYEALRGDGGDDSKFARFAHGFDSWVRLTASDSIYSVMRYADETELTRLAIALELFRRGMGSFPEKLDVLVPDFLPGIPKAFIPGQSFQYERSGPLSYRIWSFGWNGTDERGVVEKWKKRDGDWGLSAKPVKP